MGVCQKCGRGNLWCPKCCVSFCSLHQQAHLRHCYEVAERASDEEYGEVAYTLLQALPNATEACRLLGI